jgi:hypothetical protein
VCGGDVQAAVPEQAGDLLDSGALVVEAGPTQCRSDAGRTSGSLPRPAAASTWRSALQAEACAFAPPGGDDPA